ncbi:ribonuclease H [Senna tora]|uniref:Ribonuclease H n=1 Tax=Senna tora TaxID=362788 RepID=A0A835CMZ2_9FABA|nr:ribonuclease H [Senna tora]
MAERTREKLSTEEADLKARSIKKLKVGEPSGGLKTGEGVGQGSISAGEQGFVSFRDKLVNLPSGTTESQIASEEMMLESDEVDEDDGRDESENSDSDESEDVDTEDDKEDENIDMCPKLVFTQEEYDSCQCYILKEENASKQKANGNGGGQNGVEQGSVQILKHPTDKTEGIGAAGDVDAVTVTTETLEAENVRSENFGPWNLVNRASKRKGSNQRRIDHGGNQGIAKNSESQRRVNNFEGAQDPNLDSQQRKPLPEDKAEKNASVFKNPNVAVNGRPMKKHGVKSGPGDPKWRTRIGKAQTTSFNNPIFSLEVDPSSKGKGKAISLVPQDQNNGDKGAEFRDTGPNHVVVVKLKEPPNTGPILDFMEVGETSENASSENANDVVVGGGIWCMWNTNKFMVEVITKHPQFMHMKISSGSSFWFFTVVYGSLQSNSRRELWHHLNLLSHSISDPWAIAGDFNSFLYSFEKQGGSINGSRLDGNFRSWIEEGCLMDLGYYGSEFTWRRGDVAIRLDRVIANDNWRHTFTEASVVHLPRYKSYHNPLWIRFNPSADSTFKKDRPFRFLAPWVMHEGFGDLVKDAWRDGVDWGSALNEFYGTVKDWNKKTFGSGGLGLRHLKHQNTAFMTKLGWGLVNQRDELWARILRGKYHCGNNLIPSMKSPSNSSHLWKSLVRNWGHVKDGIEWRIGNGMMISFWTDSWVPNCTRLCDIAIAPIPNELLNAKVSDLVTPSGDWDWQQFDYLLPDYARYRIAAILPPSYGMGQDKVAWKYSKDGGFNVKTAYQSIAGVDTGAEDILWKKGMVFAIACWSLWRWRNESIFGSNHNKATDIFFTIIQRVHNCNSDFEAVLDSSQRRSNQVSRVIRWIPPDAGWVKVNVDGAVSRDGEESAACGGIIRDESGCYIAGFTRRLGSCSSIQAELWSVYLGLFTAWQYGFRRVAVEMDSLVACEMIKGTIPDTHPCASLVGRIQVFCQRDWEVQILHTYREGNKAADAMAREAFHGGNSLSFVDAPSPKVVAALEADGLGLGTVRVVVV